jgi:hypothetical protein
MGQNVYSHLCLAGHCYCFLHFAGWALWVVRSPWNCWYSQVMLLRPPQPLTWTQRTVEVTDYSVLVVVELSLPIRWIWRQQVVAVSFWEPLCSTTSIGCPWRASRRNRSRSGTEWAARLASVRIPAPSRNVLTRCLSFWLPCIRTRGRKNTTTSLSHTHTSAKYGGSLCYNACLIFYYLLYMFILILS